MSKQIFYSVLQQEVARVDSVKITKRKEKLIQSFTSEASPKALIDGKMVRIFNSNDYLGLRLNHQLKQADHQATEKFGTGPGAVRFISGTLQIHKDLEKALAHFHNRDDAMVFSSAFATNQAVMFCLLRGQSQDSLVGPDVLLISDALNHRSIIDGIRLANLDHDHKAVFNHLDLNHLDQLLKENLGKVKRVLVVSDGVFSMLGEYQDLKKMREIIDRYDSQYEEGVFMIIDDAHGIGVAGANGRGTEELFGVQADVLIGTMGKAFGSDGGYVVANQTIIDYLRESSATYIYSNSVTPGTAGAALTALELMDKPEGKTLLSKLNANISQFKTRMTEAGFSFAANSIHAVQPLLIGDSVKATQLTEGLFNRGILVTNLSYPVVVRGRDEIRVQLSAVHTQEDLDYFLEQIQIVGKEIGLIK